MVVSEALGITDVGEERAYEALEDPTRAGRDVWLATE